MHNLKVFLQFCIVNLKLLFAYRASFYISFILNLFWVLSFVIFIEVLFTRVNTLAGLGKGEVLLIMSFYYVFQNLGDIFYRENFEEFADKLRRGDLDFSLIKPASTRLLTFFHRIRFDFLSALIVTAAQFWYAIANIKGSISIITFLIGIFYSLLGTVLFFSILSLIATLTFWLQKNESLNTIIWHLSQVARYPRGVYVGFFRYIVTYFLPLALIANIPAEITLKFQTGTLHYYFIFITFALFFISKWFWSIGIKRYSSAA